MRYLSDGVVFGEVVKTPRCICSWVGAAIGAAASIYGAVSSSQGQAGANAENMAIEMQNEQWQTEMSNTAVQRRAADMKAAGINPILAAGSPASQPTAPMPTMQNPNAQSAQMIAQAGQQANQAIQNEQIQAQTSAAKAQANKDNATAMKTSGVDTDLAGALTVQSASQNRVNDAQVENVRANSALAVMQATAKGYDIGLTQQQISQVKALTAQVEAQTGKTISETHGQDLSNELLNSTIPALQQMSIDKARLLRMDVPAAQAASDAAGTLYGKYVAPYLPGVLQSGKTAADLGWLFK